MKEISPCDISGITTKAPCEAALIGERHVRIEISDFVMRTFVLLSASKMLNRMKEGGRSVYRIAVLAEQKAERQRYAEQITRFCEAKGLDVYKRQETGKVDIVATDFPICQQHDS